MRFKAEILEMYHLSKYINEPIDMHFLFSKNKIFFTDKMKAITNEFHTDIFFVDTLKDGTNYTLERSYHDKTDKPIYQITLANKDKYYLQVDALNKLILMLIHKRTMFQKEPLAIAAIIISIIALFKNCN